jgi:hypothetical protein
MIDDDIGQFRVPKVSGLADNTVVMFTSDLTASMGRGMMLKACALPGRN